MLSEIEQRILEFLNRDHSAVVDSGNLYSLAIDSDYDAVIQAIEQLKSQEVIEEDYLSFFFITKKGTALIRKSRNTNDNG